MERKKTHVLIIVYGLIAITLEVILCSNDFEEEFQLIQGISTDNKIL
jgi:hypothetical protein